MRGLHVACERGVTMVVRGRDIEEQHLRPEGNNVDDTVRQQCVVLCRQRARCRELSLRLLKTACGPVTPLGCML